MTGGNGLPNPWTYSAAPDDSGPRRPSRRLIILGSTAVAIVLLLVVGLVAWLAWPHSATPDQADTPTGPRPLLSDKPPTVILNAIDLNSLYPPGYTDYDSSKSKPDSDYVYDPDRKYDTTSEPPGCTFKDDPIYQAEYDYDNKDPEKYDHAKILRLMYPVDDPGGNNKNEDGRTGFSLSVFPAKDPTSLDNIRQWYQRCQGAKSTTTVTKHGQVIETTTDTFDRVVTDAPQSAADDSFALRTGNEDDCDYYGLARGMIVNVGCPLAQKDAGTQLWRKVIIGLQAI